MLQLIFWQTAANWLKDYALPIGTVAIGLSALVIAAWNVRQSKRNAVSNVLSNIMKEYAESKMADDLNELRRFKIDQRNLLDRLAPLVERPEAETDDALAAARDYVNRSEDHSAGRARRNVDFHFQRLYRMHELCYLPDREFRLVANESGRNLLFEVVRPLSLAVTLIRRCESDWEAYRRFIPDYAWYAKFAFRADPVNKCRYCVWWKAWARPVKEWWHDRAFKRRPNPPAANP